MNRNPIATNARCLLGASAFVRAGNAHMSSQGKQALFSGADPGPGEGDTSP
jgi:hypothetical protein